MAGNHRSLEHRPSLLPCRSPLSLTVGPEDPVFRNQQKKRGGESLGLRWLPRWLTVANETMLTTPEIPPFRK